MSTQSSVVIATISSLDDPLGQGRVQVSFPHLKVTSAWAPVAGPLAGDNYGNWWMPEVGDVALVAFDKGNFNFPFILGFVWQGSDKPPDTDIKHRVIRTPGGHQLRFEDTDGSKKVIVKTDGGLTITMDDSQQSIELKGGGRAVTMKGGELKIT